jgi:hypothetical protein
MIELARFFKSTNYFDNYSRNYSENWRYADFIYQCKYTPTTYSIDLVIDIDSGLSDPRILTFAFIEQIDKVAHARTILMVPNPN